MTNKFVLFFELVVILIKKISKYGMDINMNNIRFFKLGMDEYYMYILFSLDLFGRDLVRLKNVAEGYRTLQKSWPLAMSFLCKSWMIGSSFLVGSPPSPAARPMEWCHFSKFSSCDSFGFSLHYKYVFPLPFTFSLLYPF